MSVPKAFGPYQYSLSRIGNRHIQKGDLLRELGPALDLLERQIDPLSSPTVLPFLDDNDLPDKAIKYAHPNFYYLDRSSSAVPDGINIVATATNNGRWYKTTFGGLDDYQHEFLRTLTHDVVETTYTEITRSSGLVTKVVVWMSPAKLVKHREADITRLGGVVNQVIERQYNTAGTLLYSLVHNITRSSGLVFSVSTTRI